MPSKHIDDLTWRKVEEATVKAVVQTRKSIKDTEMLRWLVLKGIETMTDEDIERLCRNKN